MNLKLFSRAITWNQFWYDLYNHTRHNKDKTALLTCEKSQKNISDKLSILLTKTHCPENPKNYLIRKQMLLAFKWGIVQAYVYVEYYCHSVGLNRALLVHLFLHFLEDFKIKLGQYQI